MDLEEVQDLTEYALTGPDTTWALEMVFQLRMHFSTDFAPRFPLRHTPPGDLDIQGTVDIVRWYVQERAALKACVCFWRMHCAYRAAKAIRLVYRRHQAAREAQQQEVLQHWIDHDRTTRQRIEADSLCFPPQLLERRVRQYTQHFIPDALKAEVVRSVYAKRRNAFVVAYDEWYHKMAKSRPKHWRLQQILLEQPERRHTYDWPSLSALTRSFAPPPSFRFDCHTVTINELVQAAWDLQGLNLPRTLNFPDLGEPPTPKEKEMEKTPDTVRRPTSATRTRREKPLPLQAELVSNVQIVVSPELPQRPHTSPVPGSSLASLPPLEGLPLLCDVWTSQMVQRSPRSPPAHDGHRDGAGQHLAHSVPCGSRAYVAKNRQGRRSIFCTLSPYLSMSRTPSPSQPQPQRCSSAPASAPCTSRERRISTALPPADLVGAARSPISESTDSSPDGSPSVHGEKLMGLLNSQFRPLTLTDSQGSPSALRPVPLLKGLPPKSPLRLAKLAPPSPQPSTVSSPKALLALSR
eukprot:EG_transcript_5808